MADVTKLYITRNEESGPFNEGNAGDRKRLSITITWGVDTNTYPTGGVALDPLDIGVDTVPDDVISFVGEPRGLTDAGAVHAYRADFNRETGKVELLAAANSAEASGDIGAHVSRATLVVAVD